MKRFGTIYFQGQSTILIGVARFVDGQCVQFLYNKYLLEHLLETQFRGLYQAPESIEHVVIGCDEKFWNGFYCKDDQVNSFIQYRKVQEYREEDLLKEMVPLINFTKLLDY